MNLVPEQEIIFESVKRKRTYIELFCGFLLAFLLITLQYKIINNFNIFDKFILISVLLYFLFNALDYFILDIALTKEFLFVKSIFTLGKTIKISLNKIIKVLSISSDYTETKEGYAIIFTEKLKYFPIILGPILYIEQLKTLIQKQ